MSKCQATQQGDEMFCSRCVLRWDVADVDRPTCLQVERRSRPRGPVAEAMAANSGGIVTAGAPTHEADEFRVAPPAEPGNADLEAVAWAYRKLLAFGVGAANMESALMMDRLNLMLLGA